MWSSHRSIKPMELVPYYLEYQYPTIYLLQDNNISYVGITCQNLQTFGLKLRRDLKPNGQNHCINELRHTDFNNSFMEIYVLDTFAPGTPLNVIAKRHAEIIENFKIKYHRINNRYVPSELSTRWLAEYHTTMPKNEALYELSINTRQIDIKSNTDRINEILKIKTLDQTTDVLTQDVLIKNGSARDVPARDVSAQNACTAIDSASSMVPVATVIAFSV
jgi:hypothetical protein